MEQLYFDEIDSTNKYLKENYENLPNMTFLHTGFQTSGKGRMNRVWESNKYENLIFSILAKDENLIKEYSSISLLIASVVLKTLQGLGISGLSIKWPNDVYIEDSKVCGILLESVSHGENISALVIGVGLNVNQKTFNIPDRKITSISNILNRKINLNLLRGILFFNLEKELSFLKEKRSGFLDICRQNNYLKNKKCSATINNELKEITVLDIADDNSLIVNSDGKILNIFSGEITFQQS